MEFLKKPFQEFTDIGKGHQIRISYDKGYPWLLEDWHPHNTIKDQMCSVSIPISQQEEAKGYKDKKVWYWDPITETIDPSIICGTCRCHGWIKNGSWGYGRSFNRRFVSPHRFLDKLYDFFNRIHYKRSLKKAASTKK